MQTLTPTAEEMFDSADDRIYVGIAHNKTNAEGSGDPAEFDYTSYKWSKIKGTDGLIGAPGSPGNPGAPGDSFNWIGEFAEHPTEEDIGRPIANGDTYLNLTDNKVYTFSDGSWYTMLQSGGAGPTGPQGAPGGGLQYQGEFESAPSGALLNWLYRDTNNGILYIYTGNAWTVATSDGKHTTDGADCGNGLRFFTTYSALENPSRPTGDGNVAGEWNVDPHSFEKGTIIRVSQKLATEPTESYWSQVIDITEHGFTGPQGFRGSQSIMVAIPNWNGEWDDAIAASAVTGGAPQEWDVVTLYKSEDPSVQSTRRFGYNSQRQEWEWLAYNYNFLGDVLVDGTVDGTAFNAATTITAGRNADERAYMSGEGDYRFWAGADNLRMLHSG